MADGTMVKTTEPLLLQLPDGIHENIAAADYHVRVPGLVSKGVLDMVERSPAHAKAWLDGAERNDTSALRFGNALHCALLEPDVFLSRYIIKPKFKGKGSKAAKEAWEAENETALCIDPEDLDVITAMRGAILAHPVAGMLLQDGKSEVTALWTDPETGLRLKSRADYYVPSMRLIVDLKSTEDARPKSFPRSVANFRYHVQDAFYRMVFTGAGYPVERFVFLAVEKDEPYAIAVHMLDEAAQERGRVLMRKNLRELARCVETRMYPGYDEKIHILSLPTWAA